MLIRDIIVALAKTKLGTPYRWGGDRAFTAKGEPHGYDCSGFVIEVLRAAQIPSVERGDWSAAGLAKLFRTTHSPQPGDLAFYGPDETRINHVMVYLGGKPAMCIGATGGGKTTTTFEEARRRSARVKIVKVAYRRDFLGYRSVILPATADAGGAT